MLLLATFLMADTYLLQTILSTISHDKYITFEVDSHSLDIPLALIIISK